MNRTSAIVLALASVLGVAAGVAGQADKVTVCHMPPGNPDQAHTITIGGPAGEAHMGEHGDASGACPGEEAKSPGDKDKPENPPGDEEDNANTENPGTENPGPTTAATPLSAPTWIWLVLALLAGIIVATGVVLRRRMGRNP